MGEGRRFRTYLSENLRGGQSKVAQLWEVEDQDDHVAMRAAQRRG